MHQFVSLVFVALLGFLSVAGCGISSRTDMEAAREEVRHFYSAPHGKLEFDQIEGPEYAHIPKIPRDHLASWAADRSAACGIRVRFTWWAGKSWTKDDWIVWVSSEHKPVGFSPNPMGDDWRQFVRSAAKK